MVELVDTRDLKSLEVKPRAGSNPAPDTIFFGKIQVKIYGNEKVFTFGLKVPRNDRFAISAYKDTLKVFSM